MRGNFGVRDCFPHSSKRPLPLPLPSPFPPLTTHFRPTPPSNQVQSKRKEVQLAREPAPCQMGPSSRKLTVRFARPDWCSRGNKALVGMLGHGWVARGTAATAADGPVTASYRAVPSRAVSSQKGRGAGGAGASCDLRAVATQRGNAPHFPFRASLAFLALTGTLAWPRRPLLLLPSLLPPLPLSIATLPDPLFP